MGVSAGSYIAGPTIEQETWKHQDRNRVGITNFMALGLVQCLITANFKEKYQTIVEQAAKMTDEPIVALTDQQAIVVRGKKVQIIGEGKKEYWNGFKER